MPDSLSPQESLSSKTDAFISHQEFLPAKFLCSYRLCFNWFLDEGKPVPGFCGLCGEAFCSSHLRLEGDPRFGLEPICSGCREGGMG